MQCVTDLIFLPEPVQSLLKNSQFTWKNLYLRESVELDYQAFQFLPPSRIQNLGTLHCLKL